ncbi:MAG: 50S ribosomal protein L11 methyltransferase [Ruoffia tabacinasalis]|uniref:50S ribosomal protein L11 methyltransferase n=1 Tax=unclassified Ruoffia TaxID=2862149 RepID=UPI000EE901F2|nr:50S ribosomal protein L11 methyltransferase [Aerococcaceae bacterium]
MDKIWKEIKVTLDSLQTVDIDLVNYYLNEAGAVGNEIKYAQGYLENHPNLFGEIPEELPEDYLNHPVEVIGYYESEIDLEKLEEQLKTVGTSDFKIEVADLETENWHENWRQYYKPERISRFLSIVPEWQDNYEAAPFEQVIFMDPGVAFGTGNHPTTRLSAQALEMVMQGGETVLDVGTGTGILSFIASVFGAKEVLGMDFDPQAVNAAISNLNAQKNHEMISHLIDAQKIRFIENDLLKGIDQTADVIVANILPHILVNLFSDAHKLLNDNGYLILGGILNEKASFIEEAIETHNFEIYQKTQMREWVNYIVVKGDMD